MGVEPTSTGLQPVAWPSGSSVLQMRSWEFGVRNKLQANVAVPRVLHSALRNPHSAFRIARPGIEPGLRPSRGRVQSATLTGCKYRVRESNPVPQFRRLRCYPAHPHGIVSISTWGRTRTWALGGPRAVRPVSSKHWPSRYGADDWIRTSMIRRFI